MLSCLACGRPLDGRAADETYLGTPCRFCGHPFGVQKEPRAIVPRRLFSPSSAVTPENVPQATPVEVSQVSNASAGGSEANNVQSSAPAQAFQTLGATFSVDGRMPPGVSQICNTCGYATPPSNAALPCKQCGYVGFPVTQPPVHPVGPASFFNPVANSTSTAKPRLPAQTDDRELEMSQVSFIGLPKGQFGPSEQICVACRQSKPPEKRSTVCNIPCKQCGYPSEQICIACRQCKPSEKSCTVCNIPCKQCGYMGFANDPQYQRPVPLLQPQMARDTAVPFPVTQPSVPHANAPASFFQPAAHSTTIANPRLPLQQDGRGLAMPPVHFDGALRRQSEMAEHCLPCCSPGYQPYAGGVQGGLWLPTFATRNAMHDLPQRPQRMYPSDPYRRQPGEYQLCSSSRVPGRAVAPNVSPTTPVAYRLLNGLGGSAGRGGGGGRGVARGNEFVVLDETAGRAERWTLLPSASYSFKTTGGDEGRNLQPLSPSAPAQRQQEEDWVPLQALDIHPPAQAVEFPQAPGAERMQLPRQPEVFGTLPQRVADGSAVYVRLSDPPASSPRGATGPQLLSQRKDTSPAVFVRLSPLPGNAVPQRSRLDAFRGLRPPPTILGNSALKILQDMADEKRQLQRRSAEFLDRYHQLRVRRDFLRHGNVVREPSPPAAAPTQQQPLPETAAPASASTRNGQRRRREASPAAARDSEVQSPVSSQHRVLMQGSLRSILATEDDSSYSQSQRINDFRSDSNNGRSSPGNKRNASGN